MNIVSHLLPSNKFVNFVSVNYLSSFFTDDDMMLDLQSLATLATARALEMDLQEGSSAGAGHHCPARRTLNLRRKCSWTPRNEPVSCNCSVNN